MENLADVDEQRGWGEIGEGGRQAPAEIWEICHCTICSPNKQCLHMFKATNIMPNGGPPNIHPAQTNGDKRVPLREYLQATMVCTQQIGLPATTYLNQNSIIPTSSPWLAPIHRLGLLVYLGKLFPTIGESKQPFLSIYFLMASSTSLQTRVLNQN